MKLLAAALAATLVFVASPAGAQTPVRVRVVQATPVMETPRGDSVVLGRVTPGMVLERLQESGRWIQVAAPAGAGGPSWVRGWIPADAVEFVDAPPPAPDADRGEFMIRGFGQFGTQLFTASDSFEAVLDSKWGAAYGAGAQVVFPNGVFVQAGFDRFEETGSRVIVSETQVFRTSIPNTVTLTPILATIGYREITSRRVLGYVGGGVGWHVLEEESPALAATGHYKEEHIGYHVSGGAEFRLAPFAWLAGEVQWASVPDGLGEAGIGAVFDESDLGATTFRLKVIIGR
ncbi:MAG TPA: hypothetical protein VHJ69_02415 [Gemmatimonadales bacterium]|nr:hypothetical protein [Gemmatimonadales bacterium]